MFRIIFAAQAIIYLIIAPLIKESSLFGYNAPMLYGAIAVAALIIGFYLPYKEQFPSQPTLVASKILLPFIVIMAIMYCSVSFSYDLLNRRIGSEIIAEVYGNLPLWALAILRIYEISLVPCVILLVLGGQVLNRAEYGLLIVTTLISIPFMGLADSRSKLLVIVLSFIIFIRTDLVKKALKKSLTLYLVGGLVVVAFVYASMDRATKYARVSDFYIAEVMERLDGLTLIRELSDIRMIPAFGNYDFDMFKPLQSKISFLDEAKYLKTIGKTSTKQYFLQNVLNTKQLDSNNSMATDPLYFAGIPGLFICFTILGFLVSKFDRIVSVEGVFKSRFKTAVVFAFGLSFLLIEVDLMGAITSFFQNFVIFYGITLLGMRAISKDQYFEVNDHRPQASTVRRSQPKNIFA